MIVVFEDLDVFLIFVLILKFNWYIIGCSEDEWLCGVNGDGMNVVGMCFERCDFFGGVVVVDM